MRSWKILYLVLAFLLFVALIVPVLPNIAYPTYVVFFKPVSFLSMYKIVIPMAMLDWAFVALYLKSLASDISRSGAKKFDLN